MKVTWLPPPSEPKVRTGEIHVWFCDYSAITDLGAWSRTLGEAEARRAERFRSEDARLTFVGAHILLRRVLGAYLQISPLRVAFKAEAGGKPQLDSAVHSTDLQFNLSHSHRNAICAVTHAIAVGVDIERRDPKLCELATAEQVFSTQELRRLQELDPTERSTAFFRAWTKKEAYAKCKGVGLGADLKLVELGLYSGIFNFESVSLATFECPSGHIATVAVEGVLKDPKFCSLGAESLMIG